MKGRTIGDGEREGETKEGEKCGGRREKKKEGREGGGADRQRKMNLQSD